HRLDLEDHTGRVCAALGHLAAAVAEDDMPRVVTASGPLEDPPFDDGLNAGGPVRVEALRHTPEDLAEDQLTVGVEPLTELVVGGVADQGRAQARVDCRNV